MSEWQTLYRTVDLHVQQHTGEKLQGNWRDTFKECIQKRCSCATLKKVGRLCVCHVLIYWGLLHSRCLLCNESFQQDKLDASERDMFNV